MDFKVCCKLMLVFAVIEAITAVVVLCDIFIEQIEIQDIDGDGPIKVGIVFATL